MEYSAEIYQLTQAFIKDFPLSEYPEMMHKLGRPYNCLFVDTHCDYYICIPYRSQISHDNAFLFKGTKRSLCSKSGLDYSKIILVTESRYLTGEKNSVIDQDEYNETQKNLDRIVNEAIGYIDGYIGHITGTHPLHPQEFKRRYRYSTLPYFHKIMNI